MDFIVDKRIEASSAFIIDSYLSRIFVKNDKNYLWFILVPREDNIQEIFQLEAKNRIILMEEISQLAQLISLESKADKINVGALGNIVSQLHVHIVARFSNDYAWPHSIWQPGIQPNAYEPNQFSHLIKEWQERLLTHIYFSKGC